MVYRYAHPAEDARHRLSCQYAGRGLSRFCEGFRQGLSSKGHVDDQNVAIEYRWAEDRYDRLPDLAADLVHMKVDVIVASGYDVAAKAPARFSRDVRQPIFLLHSQRALS